MLYGREWVVYYTEDIPLPYGPWKLGGLPGLITEAYTTDSCYHFTMTGFENLLTEKAIQIPVKVSETINYENLTRKQYLEMRYTHRTDPKTLKKKSGVISTLLSIKITGSIRKNDTNTSKRNRDTTTLFAYMNFSPYIQFV